ncbi:hypothetical protein M9978_22545 [Sphingomonas sp. MG17]|uniref:Uncharacterized protein n=2 Tax=Sphingomonas tagetis TaxID=2949092 RepID=A0A9X2HN23_9SPHN|nr:hypothetical protein [Sphingomonas tagetis]
MSSDREISAFIRATFRSVWALELLCYLRKHRDRPLLPDEIVVGLRASDLVVQQSIDALLAAGLVAVDSTGAVGYRPANEDLDRAACAAEALYARSPDAVRRLIVAAANSDITKFADSFRLRKD